MSTLREIGNKLFKEELASQKVELATIDEIKLELKAITELNSKLSKLDSIVQKNVAPLNTAYKDIVFYKAVPKGKNSTLSKLEASLVKQANEIGIDYKQLPAFKELMDAYSFLGQMEDSINNSIAAITSIGK